jgi:hypothetical protein
MNDVALKENKFQKRLPLCQIAIAFTIEASILTGFLYHFLGGTRHG